jgi:Tfp pilus assembly protein PilP
VVLSQFAIDELKLIGIVTRVQPARAMLVDPEGTGHVVHRGQFVGRPDIVQAAGRTGASYEINFH